MEDLPQVQIPAPGNPNRNKPVSQFVEFIETVLFSILLFLVINIVTSRIMIESISMQPTLFERDRVLVNRLAYKFGQPERGDIIIFMPPIDEAGEPYIKRVIGLSGDNIHILNGQVIVNGYPLQENYIQAPPAYVGSWKVAEGQLFVLGDNRNNSSDSHSWGTVPLDNVLGKAELIYWPIGHLGMLDPSSAAAAGSAAP